jgi:hypothetical protein
MCWLDAPIQRHDRVREDFVGGKRMGEIPHRNGPMRPNNRGEGGGTNLLTHDYLSTFRDLAWMHAKSIFRYFLNRGRCLCN